MDFWQHLALGIDVAFTKQNLLYCFLGVTLGNLMGVIPGVGAVAAVSILLPATYHVPPAAGLIMLAGLYYGAVYGAVTGAILSTSRTPCRRSNVSTATRWRSRGAPASLCS